MVVAQATTVSSATACILDDGTMRRAAGGCRPSVRLTDAAGASALPAQQPAAR